MDFNHFFLFISLGLLFFLFLLLFLFAFLLLAVIGNGIAHEEYHNDVDWQCTYDANTVMKMWWLRRCIAFNLYANMKCIFVRNFRGSRDIVCSKRHRHILCYGNLRKYIPKTVIQIQRSNTTHPFSVWLFDFLSME